MKINIPGYKVINIENLIMDLNGTVAVDGRLRSAVVEKINKLNREGFKTYIVTAGTHGRIHELKEELDSEIVLIKEGDEAAQKRDFIERIGKEVTAAIGNGANDCLMLKEAVLSIMVIEEEGAYSKNLLEADIVVGSSESALDLFLSPKRLIATLRR